MTVSTTAVSVSYAGNGVTVAFPIPFSFGSSADLGVVLVDDATSVETPLALTTHYTVVQSANGTGTLTMLAAPVTGKTLLISRETALTQPDSLRNQGAYYPETVEGMVDRAVRQVQDFGSRALRIRARDVGAVSTDLPAPEAMAPLVWKADGSGLDNGDPALAGDMLLRGDLASPAGAGRVGYTPNHGATTDMAAQLRAIQSNSGPDFAHIFKRDLVVEVGFFNTTIDELRALYSYNTMYPQGLCFDPVTDEMFILRGGGVGGGDNVWAWFEVYDPGATEPKAIFTAERDWRECVHVVYIGGVRYLYSLDRSGNAYRIDITTLPANKAHVTVADTFAVGAQTQMCPLGTNAADGWAVMESRAYWGRAQRNRFTRWSQDFATNFGRIVFDYDGAGTLSADVDEFSPKLQGLCNHRGFYYGGMGGDFDESRDAPTMQNKHHGLAVFASNGRMVAHGLTNPQAAKDIWQSELGYEPSIVEIESSAAHKDSVYLLWVTRLDNGTWEALPGKGVLVTREMSSSPHAIDFSSAASSLYRSNDQLRAGVEVAYAGSQLVNPIDGATALDSFDDVIGYMRQAGLSRYAFYGIGQTMTDYAGASVATGVGLFEFIALGDTAMHIRRTTPDRTVNWRITGIGTTPVQTPDDSGWIDATLQNSWVAFGGSRATPGYRKIGNRVTLRGSAKSGSVTNGVTLFTLPSGYRPAFDVLVPLANGAAPTANTLALIDTAGLVRLFGPVDNVDVPIDGISFLTD